MLEKRNIMSSHYKEIVVSYLEFQIIFCNYY